MKKFIKYLVLLTLFFTLVACESSKDGKGTLTIYVGLSDDHAIKAIESFEKETGIKVSYNRMSNGQILSKVKAEKDEPKASVWYGGPSETFIQAKNESLLQSYESPNASMIQEQYKDPDGYWTGIYVGSLALVSNRAWLQDVGLQAPQSWQDLLDPAYKGMVTMPDPRSSGTGFTIVSTLVQLMGEDEGFSYLHSLDKNIKDYTTSGSSPGRAVGMGEAGVAIMFAHDALKFFKEGFNDIHITFPTEGTGYEIGAVGLIANAPNEPEAKVFIDWALTKQAQELGKQMGNYQLLTNENAISPEEAFYLTELNIIDYDQEWAGVERLRLIERWVAETQL